MGDVLGFAVIGCGTVSGYGHLPTIAGMTGKAGLRVVADVDPARLASVKGKYPQAEAYADYRSALARDDVDAVVIATRTDTHVEIAKAALEAGKHVLLEKPPATTVADARHLLDAARRSGRVIGIDFILRYVEGLRQIKAWCDAGEIGRLRAIRMINDWWGADHRGKFPGRGMRLLSHDGSVMVGEGIHHVDLARWITGSDFGPVQCVGTSIQHPGFPDHQVLIACMTNGVVLNMECSNAYGFPSKNAAMDRQLDLIGENGVIKYIETDGRLLLHGKDRTVELKAPDEKQFSALYDDFIASVRAGRPSPTLPTLEDSVKAMETAVRATELGKRFC